MKKNRKAVALFTTLGLISLISLMIMNAFGLMTKSFQHVKNVEKVNQTKVVINDFQQVLTVIAGKITDSIMLYELVGAYPPISDEDGLFSLSFEMNSMHKAININTIIEEQNSSTPDVIPQIKDKYQDIFEYIFNTYQIRDGELLLNYIADTLDTDSVERNFDTEIVLNDAFFLNGLITNERHFHRILEEYQAKSDDKEVMKVPWKDYFYFSYNKDESMIDCNFMTRNLANAVTLDIYQISNSDQYISSEEDSFGGESISCEMVESDDNIEEKSLYNIKEFNSSDSYKINGVVTYSTNVVDDSFKFIYDLKSKRIIDIEVQEIPFENN